MSLSGFHWGRVDVSRKNVRVVVRWWVGGDELGAGIEEELLEGWDAFLSDVNVNDRHIATALMSHAPPGHLGELLSIALFDDV